MILDFKKWLISEIRLKGFYRQWKSENPEMPNYVAHDLYTHNVGYTMDKKVRSNNQISPNDILQAFSRFGNHNWESPQIIEVTPLSFDDQTRNFMIKRRFGAQVIDAIPDDEKRTKIQNKINKADGNNEPVILAKTKKGLKLIEGWHRTMVILLSGAPQYQRAVIKYGSLSEIDFRSWNPVKLKAYIGSSKKQDLKQNHQNWTSKTIGI